MTVHSRHCSLIVNSVNIDVDSLSDVSFYTITTDVMIQPGLSVSQLELSLEACQVGLNAWKM